MQRGERWKLGLAVAGIGLAAVGMWRFWSQDDGVSERAFFYDLSARKLFTAARTLVPPIRGVDGDQLDAVRAVVISTNSRPTQRSSWQVAYLEMYSPELKEQMEKAQATGAAPEMGRTLAHAHRFVKRLSDPEWHAMNSPEADQIMGGWLTAGPNGTAATIVTP